MPEDEGIHHDTGALRFFTDSDGERGGILVVNEAWHVRGQMTDQVTIAGQTLVTDPDDLDELIRVLGTAATTLRARRDRS